MPFNRCRVGATREVQGSGRQEAVSNALIRRNRKAGTSRRKFEGMTEDAQNCFGRRLKVSIKGSKDITPQAKASVVLMCG